MPPQKIQCDILIDDCTLLNKDFKIEEPKSVAVKNGIIEEVGQSSAMSAKYKAAQLLSGENKLLMPGFVDGHTHVCQQLLRGRAGGREPMTWSHVLVPFESALTPEDVRVSAQLACLEMIKAGFTGFADAGGVHMDQAAESVLESGMRAAICRSSIDIGDTVGGRLIETRQEIIERFKDLYNAYHGKGNGRLQIWLGLREIMTCSPELMRETAETASQYHTGIHAHLCEHRDEVSFSLEHYHLRPAELLAQTGVLGPNLLTAHNVLLSDHDIALLADSKTHIIHCPKANLGHHGFPRVPTILEHGGVIGLGCDGASSVNLDMFELMRVIQLATIASQGLPIFDKQIVTTTDMLRMATVGGASAIGGETLGIIEEGCKADMIMLDINQPHLNPTKNLAVTVVYCGHGHDVTDSIIDGRLVMRDRKLLTLDEEKIIADASQHMRACISRAGI